MLNDYDDSYMSYNELIEAIIAAGNPYAGRNSKLDRSLRARRQLRDRKGRWIYMGGGLGFTVRMPDGTLYRVLGRSVGASRREGFVQVYIPDGTAEGLPGGFYDVPASGSDVVQAILPGQEGAGKYTGSPTAAEIVNLGDLQVKDAPDGWRKNRDGSYTSEGSEFTVTAPDAEGKVKLQRDGRTVATLRDPATAIARAAKIDIEDTVDTDTKKVVARLKKDVTEARRSLRDSTTEEEATQAQEALKKSAEQVDRALFNDPEIMGEQDFEAERRAKELSGLQAQDEELDRENSEIETQLEGMNRRTAEAQKLKARQREIAEERADISDSIAELSPQPETDGPTPPDGTDTPQAGPDEDGDGEPDYYVDPNTGEIIDNEPDEVLEDGGVYILDGERVQEEGVADWLSKAPEYSQIFIKGTNADGQPELYKFIKSPSGDWIEFSFTSETIPIRTSKELADFMRNQRTNGGLVASDESAINGGDLQTIEDALDDLRLEAEGRRERRPGDFQRARERARRVLDGDSGVEFEEGFDPANQEVVSFDREDGPPKEFYRPKKMWANYFHKNDWVEGQDGKWRKVVSKETFTEMRPSTDPNKGPYSFRRHTITFDDGSTYEIETKNGWPDSQEKKNEFQVVRETKDRRFEATDSAKQPEPVEAPTPDTQAPAAPTDTAAEASRLDALTPEKMEFEKGWKVAKDEDGNVVLARTVGSSLTPGGPKTETKPLQYLYRAISDAEWEGIKKNGYMKTSGLGNLDYTSGTYATHDDPSTYLPSGLGVGGRIIRIAYDPSDNWGVVDLNGYVQTDKNVPSSRIEAVSASTIGTGAAARDPKDPELAGDVVRNVASNMIARAEADRRAAKDAGDTEREQMLEGVLADINKVREQFMLSDGNLVELQDIDSEGYLQAIENIQASAPEYSGSQDTNKDIDAARKILSTTKTEAAPTEGAEPVTAKRPFNDDLTRAFNYQYGSNLDFRYLIADNGRAKPTVVTPEGLQQAIADGATPIYRVEGLSWNGEATDEDGEPIEDSPDIRADKLRTSDIPPFKDGQFGFGIYFSNDYEEVKNNYSDPEGNDYFVAAALPKDAKVISYDEIQTLASERRDQARARGVERRAALQAARERGEELVEPTLSDEEIREREVDSALLHYTDTTEGASALASQLGYDAIVETFGEGENQYSYYVVLNRGKLIVSDTDAREAANGQTPENTRQVDATPDNSPETVADDVVAVENADQAAEETSSPIVIAQQKAVSEAAKGRVDAALKPPRAPREPSIGAVTGRLAELLKDAKTPEEVRDIINSQEITYIDFETTGFSAVPGDGELNRPIQMGIVKVRNGEVVDQRNIWMNPDTELSEWSRSNLKDSNNQPLTQEWLAQQPSMEEAMREAVEFMGSNAILAGQNVQFDLEVLGRTLRDQGIDFTWDGTLDTRDMSAGSLPKYDPETGVGPHKTNRDGTKSHSNSLGDIVNFLNEEGFNILQENWHTADEDALVSHKIMQAMLQRAINTDTPLDFMWNTTGKPEEWAAYNREYAKYRDQLRDYFTTTNDPNIEDRMAQAEPVRLEDLAPAFLGQAPERAPDTAEVSATETAVDDANATVDDLDGQLDRTVDQDEASDILDALVDEVEKADTAQTEAAKAIVASNDNEVAALNRHIDRLDRQIQRQIDRNQDPSDLMAEQEALIDQRDNLERGVTDGPGADAFRGGQAFLSLTESGPNSSRVKLERRGDSLRNLDGDVVARLIPQVSNADERRERGEVVVDLFEVEKGFEGVFVDAISEAKAANKKYGSSVDVHDEEYYQNARVFISEDGLIGAALNGGEEIVSVFRHPNAAQGVAGPIVGKLVELGGRRLDAMDTILPYIYAREGFKPVGRIDWVEKFAPDGWDKEVYAKYKKGEPDVVFMVFDPERIGSDYTPGEGTKYEDYGQAMDVAVKAVADSRTPELDGFNFSSLAPALRIPDDAPDFQTGPVTQDESGRPSVAALRASKVGQVIEYTFANGRKGRFVKMSRDIWRRADNPNDTKKYFSSNFRADESLAFAEPTDADIPSVEPTPARKFAAIDPRPYAVPRNLSPEEYQTLRNVYADQVENGTTERDRRRAEETVYLLDRIIARNEGRTLPRRADRVTRSIQRRQRAAGQTPAATPQPSQPAEAPEAPVAPETPEAAAPATPERKTYPLRTDNPDSSFLDPAPYESQGTGVDGTTDSPAELIDLFDQATLAEAFNKALRDQESAINLEFPNGNSALIPTEAVRDALQILGVDTTALTEEYTRDAREILDDNRPAPRTQPFDGSTVITEEEQLSNLYRNRRALQDELVRFITANPNAKSLIDDYQERIAAVQSRIGVLQARGVKSAYELEGVDLRDMMQVDNSTSRRPDIAWQAIQEMYPDGTLLNERELLVATNTVTDSRGNQRTYSAIITRTDDEQFYTYIREENHSEPDPAKKFKSMRVTSFRHSAKATKGRGLDGADFAIRRVMEVGEQGKIASWFNNRSMRRQQGMYITQDTVDEQGNPIHTPQRVITRDALTRIKEATNSDDVSEEMIYTLYNYIAEFGSGPAVLNELAKSFNLDDSTVFRFVDAVNENLGNRDHLDKFVLWESNTGIPLFEGDEVTYVGTATQTGHRRLRGKKGRVQIRNLVHNQEGYVYTDYVYVQFLDRDGNPEGEYTLVAAKNLRIDRTSGGTDGSERVGPNAISIPRPVLTTRAFNRHASRNTTKDTLAFTAEYDRSDPANPKVSIDGEEYSVQVSRASTISDNLRLRTVRPEDMEVGDLFFTYDEETGTKRLAEVIGIDIDSDGDRLITTAIPINLGSAKVARTSYPSDFDMTFEVYREVEPMQPITAPGEDAPEAPITSAHLDRLRDALVRANKNNIDRDILAKAFRTIDNSDGGAKNLREYEDILREVLDAAPADGMREQGRLSVEEAAKVIYNSIQNGSPNPEAEAWLRRVIDAGIVREDDLRNDPEVPEDAVATPAPGTLPTTTARPAPTQRVNTPSAPTSPGEPVTRDWFWNSEPGSMAIMPNYYGDGTPLIIRKANDGGWVDVSDNTTMWDTTRELVSDYARGVFDMNGYVYGEPEESGTNVIDGVAEGQSPTEDWYYKAAPGSIVRRVTANDPDLFIEYVKNEDGTWGDTQKSTERMVRLFNEDQALSPVAISTVVTKNVKSATGRENSNERLGQIATPEWILAAREGEYIRVREDSGNVVVYLSRRNPDGEILWTPVAGKDDSTSNYLMSDMMANRHGGYEDQDFPTQILGTNFYRWSDVSGGTQVNQDLAWYSNAPAGTVINFSRSTLVGNDRIELKVNATKTPSGSWDVRSVPGEPQVRVFLSSNELHSSLPPTVLRGELQGVSAPTPPSGPSTPVESSYSDIATGPYSPEDAVPSVTPEEFRQAIQRSDKPVIRKALLEVFGNKRLGSKFRLSEIYTNATGGDMVEFSAKITDESGVVVGRTSRTYELSYNGTFTVYHSSIFIDDPKNRRTGFSTDYKELSTNFYNYIGVDQIKIGTVSDGSFVWAKMNYTWDSEYDAQAIRRLVQRHRDTADTAGRSKDVEALDDLLERFNLPFDHDEFPDPIDIANLEYSEPGDFLKSLGYDILWGSNWHGIKYLNPNMDPRPESRQKKTPEDYKKDKTEGQSPASSEERAARYVDTNGNITDAYMWLDAAPEGSFVVSSNEFNEPGLYKKIDGRWVKVQYGDASRGSASFTTEPETSLARDMGTSGARIPTPEELDLYESYFNGGVDTSNVTPEQFTEAFSTGNTFLIEAVLRNEVFGNDDRKYGEVEIKDLTFYSRSRTTSGVSKYSVNVDATLMYEGESVGEVARRFSIAPDGTLEVHHDVLNLGGRGGDARGKGFGSQFSEASEAFYEKNGVQQATLEAWWDGGSYWAGKGYQWDLRKYDPRTPRSSFLGDLEENIRTALDAARRDGKVSDAARYVEVLERLKLDPTTPGFPTPQDILALPNSKDIMYNSQWSGIKYFGAKREEQEAKNRDDSAPEFADWDYVGSKSIEDFKNEKLGPIMAGLETAIGAYGQQGANRRRVQEQLTAIWDDLAAEYHIYRRGNVTMLVEKQYSSDPRMADLAELQTKLLSDFRSDSDVPLIVRLTGSRIGGAVGVASPSYHEILYMPGGSATVVMSAPNSNTSRMSFDFSRAANPAFPNLLVGGFAHEMGHILDFDSSGNKSIADTDISRYFSVELKRAIQEYDQENGTNLWNSISGYVNSFDESDAPILKNTPATKLMEAWAESFAQFVAERYYGAERTELGMIVERILQQRGLIQ